MSDKDISTTAAEKLAAQMEDIRGKKDLKGFEATAIKYLCDPIGNMLIKFCYQNEEFAQAVERFDKPLIDLLREICKMSTKDKPGVSDVEAYAKAVKFYLPAAEVICSFRINIHKEVDDDLLDLESFAAPEEHTGAIILDLFRTGEV